jgi:hypothetical protein
LLERGLLTESVKKFNVVVLIRLRVGGVFFANVQILTVDAVFLSHGASASLLGSHFGILAVKNESLRGSCLGTSCGCHLWRDAASA